MMGKPLNGLILAAALALSAAVPAAPIDLSPVQDLRPRHALPRHWERGAFMEIFVRAYQDSDGDGIGDLRGLTSRLDHLKKLGIRGIWLMPVMKSADRDHGYATVDYRAIEPDYGTLADFDRFVRGAHRRGIGVIVDYVINHAAASHPLFVEARADPSSRWRDWFVWSDQAPPGWSIWGKYPWYHAASEPWLFRGHPKDLPKPPEGARDFYFGTFGPHMPDFDLRRPEVQAYHFDSLRFWLARGLDGYRLDATPHLVENSAKDWNDQPESRRLTKQLQTLIKRWPGRYVVCEATSEPQAWADDAVCGGAFAFGAAQHFVGAALGKAESVAELARYWRSASPKLASFVSNHDIFAGRRLWDQVAGDEARYKLAAAGYLLQPGTPFVYYGEEVGMAGVPGLDGDQPLRAPMSWTGRGGFSAGAPFRPHAPNVATHNAESQAQDPGSIFGFYRAMIGLRNRHAAIALGSFEHSFADGLVLGFQRRWQRDHVLVLINYGQRSAEANVMALPPRSRLVPAYPPRGRGARADAAGRATVSLAPLSVRVLSVRR